MSYTSIPKKIHYFWFGGKPKSARIERYIETWKAKCPDFEIIEWNESNYDIHKHPFMERAYKDGKWAFVTDYARLDVLAQYGGIYLDTDVEVLKDLSPLCEHKAFMGFEREDLVADGLGFGGVPHFPIFEEMRHCYDDLEEYIESPKLRTKVLVEHGLKLDGTRQQVAGMEIYPIEAFCPKNWATGAIRCTEATYSIHHFEASWHEKGAKKYLCLRRILNRIFGEKRGANIFDATIVLKDKLKFLIKRE
ncbi:glycosyltransferase family 32 protein [Pseudobutyrivibrio xylanivorans]|uniref:Glycosyl transferase family 32 n=1 Tax=Pseudobutyrivibrio xylanivorans TaxID=185007 RepID=A0A5P6VSU1_PSEXY|nr:glycosyltransferase [Pseudobutyrivibrio xylanivorans]QFJ53911.1 glycosyl transferase family 32 [Pseudobutyrivibrio xylanivorans]